MIRGARGGVTSRAVAYLKGVVSNATPARSLPRERTPVYRKVAPGLVTLYCVEDESSLGLIDRGDLLADGIDEDELFEIGVQNLIEIAQVFELAPFRHHFAVVLDGVYDASLLVVDQLWDEELRRFVRGDYAAVVPARSVLAFCDAGSEPGLAKLREIAAVHRDADYAISGSTYVRRNGAWEILEAR